MSDRCFKNNKPKPPQTKNMQVLNLIPLTAAATVSFTTFLATRQYYRRVIIKYLTCSLSGVMTRDGLENRWDVIRKQKELAIAFVDIDRLKQANELYGQPECSRRLAASLSVLRRTELFNTKTVEISGRFYFGDEFVILASCSTIYKPVERLKEKLKENGLSATIAICRYQGENTLEEAVEKANYIVQDLKKENIRGITVSELD